MFKFSQEYACVCEYTLLRTTQLFSRVVNTIALGQLPRWKERHRGDNYMRDEWAWYRKSRDY